MSFLPFRRAVLGRGLVLSGTLLGPCFRFSNSSAVAQQLSPPPILPAERPSAPVLDDEAPLLAPSLEVEIGPSAMRPRVSKPFFGPRKLPVLALGAPPDSFYQTPDELTPWLLGLSQLCPGQITTRILGKTPGGRPLIALEILPRGVSSAKLRRLAVLCRQHGNEPEASASGARFIREFLLSSDPRKRKLAQKTALFIVPIANPDGAAAYRRRTNGGVDMNRDWGRYKSSEVRLLEKAIAAWKPNLIVDVHQWLPDQTQPPPMAEASGGILARKTVHRMAQQNAARGYALAARSKWGLDSLCHRFWGQRLHIPAILLESRHRPGVPGARDVAIATSLNALWSAVETVSKK